MQVELTEIQRVIPYARNPRRNEQAIDKVAALIKENVAFFATLL